MLNEKLYESIVKVSEEKERLEILNEDLRSNIKVIEEENQGFKIKIIQLEEQVKVLEKGVSTKSMIECLDKLKEFLLNEINNLTGDTNVSASS
ncbi:MAG: hypothetical protein PHF86_13160 [Candidatus Nanoarchaeia archaeon]|jgi:hypothetical protein|nr:hypothetical protein [Candidatus Nanoarchaeia archaeon]